jgi:AraC family transcriptional activator of pobA
MTDVPHCFLYGETVPSDRLDYLHIASLEEPLPKHNWEIHPHRHDNLHQLLLVAEGSVLAQVRDFQSRETGPCILSIPPKEIHGFVHRPGVRGYIITIVESFLHDVFAEAERQEFPYLFNESLIVRLDPEGKASWDFDQLMRQILHEHRTSHPGQRCVIGAYLKILFVLLSRSASHMRPGGSQYDAKISIYENFLKILEGHYQDHRSVNQYAEKLGLTSNRLNRLCQRYAGRNRCRSSTAVSSPRPSASSSTRICRSTRSCLPCPGQGMPPG